MTRDSRPYKSGLYEDFFDAASTDHLTVEITNHLSTIALTVCISSQVPKAIHGQIRP